MSIQRLILPWQAFVVGGILSALVALMMSSADDAVNPRVVAEVEMAVPQLPDTSLACVIKKNRFHEDSLRAECTVKRDEVNDD